MTRQSRTTSQRSICNKAKDEPLPEPAQFKGKTLSSILRDEEYTRREYIPKWDDFNTLFYNAWLKVTFEPPHLLNKATCRAMGIYDEIVELMANGRVGNIGTHAYLTYPDLARQFIASCQLDFESTYHPVASQGKLSYKIDGRYYSISHGELCDVYHFERRGETILPHYEFGDQAKFWVEIDSGRRYDASETKQSAIHHLVLGLFSSTNLRIPCSENVFFLIYKY